MGRQILITARRNTNQMIEHVLTDLYWEGASRSGHQARKSLTRINRCTVAQDRLEPRGSFVGEKPLCHQHFFKVKKLRWPRWSYTWLWLHRDTRQAEPTTTRAVMTSSLSSPFEARHHPDKLGDRLANSRLYQEKMAPSSKEPSH